MTNTKPYKLLFLFLFICSTKITVSADPIGYLYIAPETAKKDNQESESSPLTWKDRLLAVTTSILGSLLSEKLHVHYKAQWRKDLFDDWKNFMTKMGGTRTPFKTKLFREDIPATATFLHVDAIYGNEVFKCSMTTLSISVFTFISCMLMWKRYFSQTQSSEESKKTDNTEQLIQPD